MVRLHEIKTLNYAVSDLLMCNGYETRYIRHESIPFSVPGSVIMSTRILLEINASEHTYFAC